MGGGHVDDADDAWAADWEEEDTSETKTEHVQPTNNDDDDASAWDMGDDGLDADNVAAPARSEDFPGDDDGADAWGWGDGDEVTPADKATNSVTDEKSSSAKGPTIAQNPTQSGDRELTLRETYTVTAVPDGILEIVKQVVSDAETLTDPR
jgi:centromere/kinetochore protein ZW10